MAKAQKVWAEHCVARSAPQRRRVDFRSTKRPRDNDDGDGERAFIRRRRAALPGGKQPDSAQPAASMEETYNSIDALPRPAEWGEKHDKELELQNKKFQKKKEQAAREGVLLPSETTDALKSAAAARAEQIVNDHRKREQKLARDRARALGCEVPAKSSFSRLCLASGIDSAATSVALSSQT